MHNRVFIPKTPVTFLALHGFTGWGGDFKLLAEKSNSWAEWICPDLPGHGKTPLAHKDKVFEQTRQMVSDALHAILLRKNPVCLGYSLGGRMLLHTLIHENFAIPALILIGTHPGINTPSQRKQRIRADRKWVRLLRDEGIERFLHKWKSQPLLQSQSAVSPPLHIPWLQDTGTATMDSISRILEQLSPGALPDCRHALQKIPCPVLLVSGESDLKYMEINQEMAALMPHAETSIIPESGHAPHLENPESFLHTISDFLRRWIPAD